MSPRLTLLDILTSKNPVIDYSDAKDKSKSQSSHSTWKTPKYLREWTDFNFPTLQSIYNKRLFQEVNSTSEILTSLPCIRPSDREVCDEPSTIVVISKWNHTIVQAALDSLPNEFNACIWKDGTRRAAAQVASASTSSGIAKSGRTNPTKVNPHRQDSSAYLPCRSHEGKCTRPKTERLPKDYKTGSKWTLQTMMDKGAVDPSSGQLLTGYGYGDVIKPIRQIFNYCVENSCRYGCIISTKEVLVCRISVDTKGPGKRRLHRCLAQVCGLVELTDVVSKLRDKVSIQTLLRTHGIVECASIPWERHRKDNDEEWLRDPQLTVNLALWFVHVLAGNDYKLDKDYRPLNQEEIREHGCNFEIKAPVAETKPPGDMQRTDRKRKRGTVEPDNVGDGGAEYSFTESQGSFKVVRVLCIALRKRC